VPEFWLRQKSSLNYPSGTPSVFSQGGSSD
jgi:hypothetical protein